MPFPSPLIVVSRLMRLVLVATAVNAGFAIIKPVIERSMYVSHLLTSAPVQRLRVPVDRVPERQLRDTWHAARSQGRKHEGIDIFAPRGAPVRSTTEGIVSRIGTNKLGGTVVWVLGPAGYRHYYAHLDQVANIHTGERISAGALLGFVGNTGNAKLTPPHLHYGIYTRKGAINPFPLLAGKNNSSLPKVRRGSPEDNLPG